MVVNLLSRNFIMKIKYKFIKDFLILNRISLSQKKYERFDIGMDDYIYFNDNLRIESYSQISRGSVLYSIGSFSYSALNIKNTSQASLSIGRYCSIAEGCSILGKDHPYARISTSPIFYSYNDYVIFRDYYHDNNISSNDICLYPPVEKCKTNIVIENDVWIGQNVTIKPGVTIGNGAIVGANALVLHDIPPYSIWGGVPAKLIKYRFPNKVIELITKLKPWLYTPEQLSNCKCNFNDISNYLDAICKISSTFDVFTPRVITSNELLKNGYENMLKCCKSKKGEKALKDMLIKIKLN